MNNELTDEHVDEIIPSGKLTRLRARLKESEEKIRELEAELNEVRKLRDDSHAKSLNLLAEAEADYVALLDALRWCSGSPDFNEGGQAREGWIKLCNPLLSQPHPGADILAENKRMREALEWYANEENWNHGEEYNIGSETFKTKPNISMDRGAIARAAMAGREG
ncbi:hypothetical protein LCGC14_2894880 [marine sediment metagenome]|uniref:Uncharacterized protein n=1 Tax=marine sediment metagenome TaxID=412755 RepID=A0A0F9A3Y9_9ZZZZ